MNHHLQSVIRSIRQTTIHSPTRFSCWGHGSATLSPQVRRAMTPQASRSYLLFQLQTRLYADFYIRGESASSIWGNASSACEAASFVGDLSMANAGTGRNESGWEVVAASRQEITVRRCGLKLVVRPGDCTIREGKEPEPLSVLSLHLQKELLSASPGYYMALSNRCASGDASTQVRMYWNLKAEGAADFVRIFTRELNEAYLFFQLKVLKDPAAYVRCDAGVIYFRKADYSLVSAVLSKAYPRLALHIKPEIPVFTRFLAPGIGLAEDPGSNESFGQHRCHILADGMIRAYERKARHLEERLAIVVNRFESASISLNAPYLNPDSIDEYETEKSGFA